MVGAMQRVGAMQIVGTMQMVNTIKVRPMKNVLIIQVRIMKCTFGMSVKDNYLRSGGNVITVILSTESMITRTG